MLRVVLRANEPLFFGGNGKKQNGASWRRGELRVRLRNLEQRRATASVVGGAVEDLIAFEGRVAAQVIPVRGVDDVFVFLVAAVELRGDVLGLNFAVIDLDVEGGLGIEWYRLEVFRLRRRLERVEIQTRVAEQLFGFLEPDPTFDGHAFVGVG